MYGDVRGDARGDDVIYVFYGAVYAEFVYAYSFVVDECDAHPPLEAVAVAMPRPPVPSQQRVSVSHLAIYQFVLLYLHPTLD